MRFTFFFHPHSTDTGRFQQPSTPTHKLFPYSHTRRGSPGGGTSLYMRKRKKRPGKKRATVFKKKKHDFFNKIGVFLMLFFVTPHFTTTRNEIGFSKLFFIRRTRWIDTSSHPIEDEYFVMKIKKDSHTSVWNHKTHTYCPRIRDEHKFSFLLLIITRRGCVFVTSFLLSKKSKAKCAGDNFVVDIYTDNFCN